MTISRKLMLIMTLTALLCLAAGYFLNIRMNGAALDKALDAELQKSAKTLESFLAQDAERLSMVQIALSHDARLQGLLVARDKDGLLRESRDLFSQLKSAYRMTHMYFIAPDGECLLRVHKPEQSGDKIARATFRQASQSGKLTSGIEMGANFFSLRVVGPVVIDGKTLGYIECGMEIDHIFNAYKRLSGEDSALLLDMGFVERIKAKVEGAKIGSSVLLESSDKVLMPKVLEGIDVAKGLSARHMAFSTSDGVPYAVALTPFKDAEGNTASMIAVTAKAQERLAETKTSTLVSSGIIALMFLLVLIILRLIFNHDVTKPLNAAITKIESVGQLQFDTQTAVPLRYELSRLGDGILCMETEIKTRLGLLQGMLETLPLSYFMTDEKGFITKINQQALTLLGKAGKPEDHQGQSVSHFFYDDDRHTETEDILAHGQIVRDKEMALPCPGGSVPVQLSAAAVKSSDGRISGVFGVLVDLRQIMKERLRTQQHLDALSRTAEESSRITSRLDDVAQQLSANIEQVKVAAFAQHGQLHQTATAMTQVESATLDISRSVQASSSSAETARQRAENGKAVVHTLIDSIEGLKQHSQSLKTSMTSLGSQANDIGGVLQVIDDIADQTNLLALNAAIEAARAGDAGRGFAVVADEVRKLAEKTMTATREVSQVVLAIQGGARTNLQATDKAVEAIEHSTALANESGRILSDILEMADALAGEVSSMASAAEEQSATSSEVARSVQDISLLATQTAESMRVVAELAESLTECSTHLSQVTQAIAA